MVIPWMSHFFLHWLLLCDDFSDFLLQSHVSGVHCICPTHWFKVVYVISCSVTYVLLYLGIMVQGYQMRYTFDGRKISTYYWEEGWPRIVKTIMLSLEKVCRNVSFGDRKKVTTVTLLLLLLLLFLRSCLLLISYLWEHLRIFLWV